MTCQECELLLAREERNRAVELHLAECSECRVLAEEMEANAEALRSLRDEEMPVLVVRARRPVRRWAWAAAAAAAVVILAATVSLRERETPPPPSRIGKTSPPPIEFPQPPPGFARIPAAPSPKPVRTPRPKPVEHAPLKEEPLVVKMLTPDPDVVIYWLIEPKETL
jgi:hypothetical protein